MRGGPLSIGTVGCAACFAVVAAAIIAASIHLRHADTSASAPAGMAATSGRNGPLARCRAIGMAAKDDAACEAAWAENRRRFFRYRPPSDRAASAPAMDRPAAALLQDE
jgi:conjugative transfer region protein TrbK